MFAHLRFKIGRVFYGWGTRSITKHTARECDRCYDELRKELER